MSTTRSRLDEFYVKRGKRILDAAIGAVGVAVSTPVIAACAVAIKLDDGGPVFFHQERAGKDGVPFTVHKLRTMGVGSEKVTGGHATVAMVTPVGDVLRRLSLDELPQFWNIMVGDMSLVGPRPTLMDQIAEYTPHQWRRLEVTPGLTGLAQIKYRNSAPWSVRIESDVEYVDNMGFLQDLRIVLGTIPAVLGGEGQAIEDEDSGVNDFAKA